ncbi:MAG: helix-turn-helix transcriptional regulator [Acidimicrobiales bacterium]
MGTHQRGPEGPATEGVARFELAPPRRFMLPAILLLLTEQPGYGYGLVPRLAEFRFGHVDRPAVYRALAQLERDGLVQVTPEQQQAGQARRVYSVTPLGERVLRVWMGVIREEHAHLGDVIRRYLATGTIDAVLSEVEQGWMPETDVAWSSVSTTSLWRRRLWVDGDADEETRGPAAREVSRGEPEGPGDPGSTSVFTSGRRVRLGGEPVIGRFVLDPERSAVLIDARSTVGPITFGTTGVEGSLHAAVVDGGVSTEIPPSGGLRIDISGLSSGNKLYDAELHRRIDSRRFPFATVELRDCAPSTPGSRYRLQGELTFHGISRLVEGTVRVESVSHDRVVISGEQVLDIRDFAVSSPTMLMLRIFPDVRVRLHAEAERAERVERAEP